MCKECLTGYHVALSDETEHRRRGATSRLGNERTQFRYATTWEPICEWTCGPPARDDVCWVTQLTLCFDISNDCANTSRLFVGFTYPKHQLQTEQDYVTSELKTRAAGYPIPIYIIGKFCGQFSENNWPNAPLQRQVQLCPYAKKEKPIYSCRQGWCIRRIVVQYLGGARFESLVYYWVQRVRLPNTSSG